MNCCAAAFVGFPFSRRMSATLRTPFTANGGTLLRGTGSGVKVAQRTLVTRTKRRIVWNLCFIVFPLTLIHVKPLTERSDGSMRFPTPSVVGDGRFNGIPRGCKV